MLALICFSDTFYLVILKHFISPPPIIGLSIYKPFISNENTKGISPAESKGMEWAGREN